MTDNKGKKYEKPLKINLEFDDAMKTIVEDDKKNKNIITKENPCFEGKIKSDISKILLYSDKELYSDKDIQGRILISIYINNVQKYKRKTISTFMNSRNSKEAYINIRAKQYSVVKVCVENLKNGEEIIPDFLP